MSAERQQLEAGIAALEAQRPSLGDAVVDAMLAPARARLAALAQASSPPEPAQTLKQVSILFLDVVGSTTLSQHLDPEAISAVMDDALARGTAIVQVHRGKVLQYAGDNILAAFGSEESREDDAESAVHCGLALLELGKVLGVEVQAAYGHKGFNIRVGIHTGGVLLGGGVDAQGTIRGSAVNIAARMEQTAPAGALRVSHDTYAHVRGLFEVVAQVPLAVKGVDAPVQSYLVTRVKPRQFRIVTRGIEGVPTRMIGREAELQALQAAFQRLFIDRRLAAVTVVADAGIGKSRLLYEFAVWSEARPEAFYLFRGRATPATGAQAFGLLRDILTWRFQIADDDSIDVARRKMERGIVPLFIDDDGADLAEAHAHLLGHLIGIEWKDSRHIRGILDDPRQIRSRALHVAAQLFRRVSASEGAASATPVVLQLEDLHWADDESLDFLNHLCEVNRDVPLLLLAFTRPTLFERRTDWRSTEGGHQRIDLAPLDEADSRLLVSELLKKLPEVPATLQALLTGRADGNPFYIEELVKMLIDQGAVLTGSGAGEAWTVDADRLLVTQVPATLTGVLQARLDSLPKPEKRALQQASVVGALFWDRALAAIEAHAVDQLPALVQRELALPRADAQLDGLREYDFRHQLLHQVIYNTVLKRHKRDGHARVAQWLARLAEQGTLRGGDFLGLAAEHFEQAGDIANAVEFHTRAAEQAAERLAHDRVLSHVSRAMGLLDEADAGRATQAELRWRLLAARELSFGVMARRSEQATDLDALTHLAEDLGDDRLRANVAMRRAGRALRMADWSVMESAARLSMTLAARAGDKQQQLRALRELATALVLNGELESGKALAMQGLEEARRLELHGVEAKLLNTLGVAAQKQGSKVLALDYDRQALHLFRANGDRVNEAGGLFNLGARWLGLGDLAQARRDLEAALHMLGSNGTRVVEALALGSLSVLSLWQGDPERALALARSTLESAQTTQSREHECYVGLRLGRKAAARQAFTQAWMLAREIDNAWQHDASAGLARVALIEGDATKALAALRPVLELSATAGSLDGTDYARWIEVTCHETLSRAGDPAAFDWLARAHTALMAQADAISQLSTDSTLRHGFLNNIPHHRAIVAAWAGRDAAPAH